MPKIHNQNRKSALARALVSGASVAEWAKAHGVPDRTAYTWARSREVLDEVDDIRRAALDRAIARLSGQATPAAEQIARLSEAANSEAVRLQASRVVLAELTTIVSYAALERRMAEIEQRLAESTPHPAGDPPDDGDGLPEPAADEWQPGEEDAACPAS
jgi:transposase-like protein